MLQALAIIQLICSTVIVTLYLVQRRHRSSAISLTNYLHDLYAVNEAMESRLLEILNAIERQEK
jgi:hypothetical protein